VFTQNILPRQRVRLHEFFIRIQATPIFTEPLVEIGHRHVQLFVADWVVDFHRELTLPVGDVVV
jgi:hypothetical protein